MKKEKFLVKKLGGENAAEISNSIKNIIKDIENNIPQVIVVSAMRSEKFNTTDALIEIGKLLAYEKINTDAVHNLIDNIYAFHVETIETKFHLKQKSILKILTQEFTRFRSMIDDYITGDLKFLTPHSYNDYSIGLSDGSIFSILSFGETISCILLSETLNYTTGKKNSQYLDLSTYLDPRETMGKQKSEIIDNISKKLSLQIVGAQKDNTVFVISGFIGTFEKGIESTIGRGYTDATAAICAIGLSFQGYDVILEVQKSVKGVLSADPKVLDNPSKAVLLKEIDYISAREITGDSGAAAKLLHSHVICKEVQDAGVSIHLYDPFLKNEEGTWIVPSFSSEKIHEMKDMFIGGRKNIYFFSISSPKLFEKSILTMTFGVVQKYYSVDIVSTSETEISFTIDGNKADDTTINNMIQELYQVLGFTHNNKMEFIEYTKENALIFCVGAGLRNRIGMLARATQVLANNNINIELMSQGRLQRAMIFGIHQKDFSKGVNVLHGLFYS